MHRHLLEGLETTASRGAAVMDDPLSRFRMIKDLTKMTEHARLDQNQQMKNALLSLSAGAPEGFARSLGKMLQLRATAEILRENKFAVPTSEELAPYSSPHNANLIGFVEEANVPFFYPRDRFPAGHTVLGDSGSGKTNHILNQVLQTAVHNPAWIFDSTKIDFRHTLKINSSFLVIDIQEALRFNPLEVPEGVKPRHHIVSFVTVFVKSLGLLEGSIGFLIEALTELYDKFGVFDGTNEGYPTLYDLYDLITNKRIHKYSREAGFKQSSESRLKALLISCPETFSVSRGFPISELCKLNCVFEVKGLVESHAQCVMCWLLFSLFHYYIANGQRGVGLALQAVIDEAMWAAKPGYNEAIGFAPLAYLMNQSRETGLSMLIGSQTTDLNESVFKSELKLCFRMTGKDIMRIKDQFRLTDEQAAYLSKLQGGRACVKVPGIDPFIIRIPRNRIQ